MSTNSKKYMREYMKKYRVLRADIIKKVTLDFYKRRLEKEQNEQTQENTPPNQE